MQEQRNSDSHQADLASNASGPDVPPPAPADDAGDQVLDIIADVEQRLQHIRQVQMDNEEQLATLAERSDAIGETERQLEEQADTLRAQQSRLDIAADALATDQEQLEQVRIQANAEREAGEQQLRTQRAELEAQHSTLEEGRCELQSQRDELESQRTALNDEHQQRLEAIQVRADELGAREAELAAEGQRVAAIEQQCNEARAEFAARQEQFEQIQAELQSRVDNAEQNVGELVEQVEASQAARLTVEETLAAAENLTASLGGRIEALEADLSASALKLEQTERETLEMIEAVETERDDIRVKLQEMAEQRQECASRYESLQSELSEVEGQRGELAVKLESTELQLTQIQARAEDLDQTLVSRDSELGSTKEKLSIAGQKLTELGEVLGEQARQLERGAMAISTVEQQNRKIEQLNADLARAKVASDPEEVIRRDARITQLTEALHQARGQSLGGPHFSEMESRISDLTAELSEQRLELEESRLELEQARATLEQQPTNGDCSQELQAREAQIEGLTTQMDQLREQCAELTQRAAAAEEAAAAHSDDEDNQEIVGQLNQQIEMLREQLANAVKAGGGSTAAELDSREREIREKATKIRAIAKHHQRRRRRLRKARELMRKQDRAESTSTEGVAAKPGGGGRDFEMRARQIEDLRRQRAQLNEIKRFLTESENEMIRKWARPRAFTLIAWVLFIMAGLATASWFAAAQFFSPAHVASVTLHASPPEGQTLGDDQAEMWTQWHQETLADSGFRNSLAQRLDTRQLEPWGNLQVLSPMLNEKMTTDGAVDGELTLTLTGQNATEICTVLDLVATTLAKESERTVSKRPDRAVAALRGGISEGGIMRYAETLPRTIGQQQLTAAGSIFGGTVAAVLLLTLALYARLSRAKRVFDAQFEVDAAGEPDASVPIM